uniref:Uncharacterized protein n=1 Tax=viral metagenome TaxID=1070528 RepID=A0A6H1ZTS1_9ZZZZ
MTVRMTEKLKKEYESILPIFQNRHTGLFGFVQNNNMYNLKKAVYITRRSAVIARNRYCRAIDEQNR